MKMTQPLIMISEYFTHILRHHYQIQDAYVTEQDFDNTIGLHFTVLDEESFDNTARLELFAKDITAIAEDLEQDADEEDPYIEFDSAAMMLFVEDPRLCLDVLSRLSDRYHWDLDKKLDDLAVQEEGFQLTEKFTAIAKAALNAPDMLAALDSQQGYIGREGLYLALLKAKALQSHYPTRPVYSLEDIRNAFNTDDAMRQETPPPNTTAPRFWLH